MVNISAAKSFINRAKRGEVLVYHTGNLSMDRRDNDDLNEVADFFMEYYQKGFVELIQRRKTPRRYEYVAIRTDNVGKRFFKGCYKEGKKVS